MFHFFLKEKNDLNWRWARIANVIVILVPILLSLFGALEFGLLFTMVTGLVQVLLALALLSDGFYRKRAVRYLAMVAGFFLLLWIFPDFHPIWIVPPVLCIHFSLILDKRRT